MKSFLANLAALGIWVTSGVIVVIPSIVMAQTQAGQEVKNSEALNLVKQGEQEIDKGQFQKAFETFQEALKLARQLKDRYAEGQALGDIAFVYNSWGQPQKALEINNQALTIAREMGDHTQESTILNNIGDVYQGIGQLEEALKYLNQALPIARKISDRSLEATISSNIGLLYQGTGKPEEALKYLNQALPIAREVSNRSMEATILSNIGLTYQGIGKSEEALKYLNQALPIAREVSNRSMEATILSNIGLTYQGIGKSEEAFKFFNKSLPIARELSNRSLEAAILGNIGVTYQGIGKLEEGLKYANQSLVIAREVGNRNEEAAALIAIGSVYDDIGKPEEALKYYNQALLIEQKAGNRSAEASILNNIGAIYRDIGKLEEALKYFNQSLIITREVSDRPQESVTLSNIGGVYSNIGKPEEALKYYKQSLPIAKEVGDRKGEATTLNNIGNVYSNIGKPEEALELFNQSLVVAKEVGDRSGEATILNNIGGIYKDRGKLEESLKVLNQSLVIAKEIGDRSGEATALSNIGGIYQDTGKPEEALKYANQALSILKKVGDRFGEATILSNIGAMYQDSNQPDKAITILKESITITLDIRKDLNRNNRQAFIKNNENTALVLVDLLINQKQAQEAFTWTNLVTTFDLADYNRLIDAKVTNPEAQKALDDLTIKDQQINALHKQNKDKSSEPLVQQILTLEAEANRQKEKIINTYPEVSELLETKPADIAQLQKSIPANTVVIQPALLINVYKKPDTVALFVVTSTQLQVIQTPLPKDFNQLLETYRQQLEKGSNYLTISGQLYDILIRSLEQTNLIPANSNIAIIATGKLREIPFESLYDNQNKQYLLEKYPIHYLTRLSKAQNNKPTTEQNQSIKPSKALAIANPLPSKQELKNTESEADYLTTTFPNSESYKNQQATLETFKLRAINFSILHLGTHGCFQLEGCQTLGMAPNTLLFANNEQYPIKDAALLGLKNTELLVIGACQTAKITKDDDVGLTGLAYIWERAGAKSVVASLWSAPDKESAELMKQFYGNLKQGMGKAEALRQAKLNILRETPDGKHPFFWSPFVLIGDGGKMGQ